MKILKVNKKTNVIEDIVADYSNLNNEFLYIERTDGVIGDYLYLDNNSAPTYISYFEKVKQDKINQLHAKYQKMYDDYLAQYPQREVDSFPTKQAEALAYTANNTASTPIIDAIVGSNAALKSAYITSIMAKVTALAQQEGKMVTIRDSIKACTTQAELDAIVV